MSLDEIYSQIVRASEEQSSGIEQINLAVSQNNQVTPAGTSKTEEVAAMLADQSSQLMDLVSSLGQ